MNSSRPRYEHTLRRVLVDMHIPDWDQEFLGRFDADEAMAAVQAAHASAVMLFFQSHVGLCYWPTASGAQHAACRGRDLAAELVRAATARSMAVCAYYSVNFNNWAYLEHPQWRLQPACERFSGPLMRGRYGIVCMNHPEYRAFLRAQASEIAGGYDIDAMFFDMVWWNGVCLCDSCRSRCRSELGTEIPRAVDWLDAKWCRFQQARERWNEELACELREVVHAIRPDIPVYHNFALAMSNWTRGVSFDSARSHDFLGGDFYGGREEQLVVSRLMLNLSASRPAEFITTVASSLVEHERLRRREELQLMAYASAGTGSAFLLINAVDPNGALHAPALQRTASALRVIEPYERFLGGDPIEDIGVYYSSASKMSFADGAAALEGIPASSTPAYPHGRAVMGACRILQQAHLPFGVITRRQLGELDRYRIVVLPNVLRMEEEEIEALRGYVRAGGRLYASGYTALTRCDGSRTDDFLLGDVYGCRFESFEQGRVVYARPLAQQLAAALQPHVLVSHRCEADDLTGAVRLSEKCAGEALAALTLPYGYPHEGSVHDRWWAAIHTCPPWTHTARPLVVSNAYGRGRCVYSAIDLESGASEAHDAMFLALVRSLYGEDEPAFEGHLHPAVWMTAFRQPERRRWIVSLLNYQAELPVIPVRDLRLRLRPDAGRRFVCLRRLPDGEPLAIQTGGSGVLEARIGELDTFTMLAAEHD